MSLDVAASIDRREHVPRTVVDRSDQPLPGRRIGVMLPNWVGDAVMATPALRALRRHYGPTAELTGIMNPTVADVLAGTNFVDDVVLYQRRSPARALGLLSVARRLRRRRLDGLLLFTNSFSSAVLGRLSGARRRIGYARYGRGPLLTRALQPPGRRAQLVPVSAVDYYLKLAYAVGCPPESPRLELAVTAADDATADQVLRGLALDAGRPLITFNNGGAYGAAKKWPREHWVGLAQRLVSQTEVSVLVVCGPAERSEAAHIEREAASNRVRSLAMVGPSIGLTKACVAGSCVVVTTDSGVRHFAAAFGVPCVTLFGPSDPRWSHNYHVEERILRVDLPCSPCGRRTCPLHHHRCLRDVTESAVYEAVRSRLDARCGEGGQLRVATGVVSSPSPCAD
jgi:heptosyltransferase-2